MSSIAIFSALQLMRMSRERLSAGSPVGTSLGSESIISEPPQTARQAWEVRTFGRPLEEISTGTLAHSLQSTQGPQRRAVAEALCGRDAQQLAGVANDLAAACHDTDAWTSTYALRALVKSGVKHPVIDELL